MLDSFLQSDNPIPTFTSVSWQQMTWYILAITTLIIMPIILILKYLTKAYAVRNASQVQPKVAYRTSKSRRKSTPSLNNEIEEVEFEFN